MHSVNPVARAEAAREVVSTDPELARERAKGVLDDPAADTEARSVALRTLALVSKLTGDARSAERLLRQAIETAEANNHSRRAAQARLSLVVVLTDRGEFTDALAEADSAAAILQGDELGQLETQRATALGRAGRHREALRVFSRALDLVTMGNDPEWMCLVLTNRGNTYAVMGRTREARRDIQRAYGHALRYGLDVFAGRLLHNLGFVALTEGDIPGALRQFASARQNYPMATHDLAVGLLDQTDAYIAARLFHEARESLEHAIGALRQGGFAVDVAEARVLFARTDLLDGDPAAALPVAREAAAEFRRQRRPRWAVVADHLVLHARVESGERDATMLTELRAVARRLASQGWAHAAIHCHVLAGELASNLGKDRKSVV